MRNNKKDENIVIMKFKSLQVFFKRKETVSKVFTEIRLYPSKRKSLFAVTVIFYFIFISAFNSLENRI